MKTLKITIAAVILACTFQAANAQISLGVSFGTPLRRVYVEPYRPYPYYHEEVIERYPVRREVYYRHTYYRRQMYGHGNHFGHEHFERRHR